MIDETLFDAEEKMEKAVSVAKDDLAGVRTGRATPHMFSRVAVEYYGAMTPLNQLASINVPEARMAVIKPYDTSQLWIIASVPGNTTYMNMRNNLSGRYLTAIGTSRVESQNLGSNNFSQQWKMTQVCC